MQFLTSTSTKFITHHIRWRHSRWSGEGRRLAHHIGRWAHGTARGHHTWGRPIRRWASHHAGWRSHRTPVAVEAWAVVGPEAGSAPAPEEAAAPHRRTAGAVASAAKPQRRWWAIHPAWWGPPASTPDNCIMILKQPKNVDFMYLECI